MAGNKLAWDGMDEFKAALRKLPKELSDDGGDIVVDHATEAGSDIRAQYEASAVSGNLAAHVKVDVQQTAAGARALVKSTAKHAVIYENGTQVRKNAAGKNLGAMPPAHVFVPTVIRARRAMTAKLIDLLERAGLEVSGA
jgi:hypothetical protein